MTGSVGPHLVVGGSLCGTTEVGWTEPKDGPLGDYEGARQLGLKVGTIGGAIGGADGTQASMTRSGWVSSLEVHCAELTKQGGRNRTQLRLWTARRL